MAEQPKTPKKPVRRQPKAATLYRQLANYLEDEYQLKAEDVDVPVGEVLGLLKDRIVKEATGR